MYLHDKEPYFPFHRTHKSTYLQIICQKNAVEYVCVQRLPTIPDVDDNNKGCDLDITEYIIKTIVSPDNDTNLYKWQLS